MDVDQEEHIDEEQSSSSEETAKTNGSNLSSELNSRDDESKKEKLKIKFKFAKTEEDEEEDGGGGGGGGGEIDVSQDKGVRTCPYCQKKFSNGKALGGHVRIHTQPKSKESFSKKKVKLNGKNNGLDPGKGLDPANRQFLHCNICNRDFPSEKSLFGHMRYHPERNWRGMQQPVIKEPKGSSPTGPEPDEDDDDDNDDDDGADDEIEGSKNVMAPGVSGQPVDLLKDLPKWLRKDRRSRECTSQSETEAESTNRLMMLAIAAELSSCQSASGNLGEDYPASNRWKGDKEQAHQVAGTQKKKRIMGDTSSGNNQSLNPLKKVKTDHKTPEAGNRRHAELKEGLACFDNNLNCDMDQAHHIEGTQKKRQNMGDKSSGKNQSSSPSKKLKIDHLISSSKTTEAGCRKHSHWKALASFDNDSNIGMFLECRDSTSPRKESKMEMGNNKATGRGSKRDIIIREEADPVETSEKQYSKPKQYKCSTCFKIFPTFQALGGHRSSHNKDKGTLVVEVHASAEAPIDEKKSSNSSTTPIMETGNSDRIVTCETEMIYQCDICSMTFPTGQALGGHKRWHWSGTANQSLSSEIESPGGDSRTGPKMGSPGDQGSHSGPGHKASGIDLNMPPAMDEEDGPL